jgi:dihydroorotate dehydrogenase electron transfer subunit
MERMMTCGFGACATCVVPTRSGNVGACMGGHVFDAKEVVW